MNNPENINLRYLKYLLAVFILLLAIPAQLYAAVSASLERNAIYAGETVTLHITTTGDDRGMQPDLAPLKNIFNVLGTGSSSQTQIVNGKRSDKYEWLIELEPLKEGKITIPEIKVGNSLTSPLTLSVIKEPTVDTAQAGQPIFIRSEISGPKNGIYVQQQFLYITRFYYRIPMIDGSFSAPDVDNAVVETLGEDQQYQTIIDGQNYNVVERHYAIFPERSGKLTIRPTVFTGNMESQTAQRSPLDNIDGRFKQMLSQSGIDVRLFSDSFGGPFFGRSGEKIRLRSNELVLDIKPQPDSYSGSSWLPTPELKLQDSWAESLPVIRAGEPVTRTLKIEATGLEASQLPSIQQTESSKLRIYPEQAELSNASSAGWINGLSEQRFTYVATQAGKLTVPEVRIDWWDTVNKEQKSTVLPALEFKVEPGNIASSTTGSGRNVALPSSSAQAAQTEVGSKTPTDKPSTLSEQVEKEYPVKLLIVSGFGGLLLLIALLLMRRPTKPVSRGPDTMNKIPAEGQKKPAGKSNNTDVAGARKNLRDACIKADAKDAARALLDWAAIIWPDQPPQSLGALADRVDQGTEAIRELESSLYSVNNHNWNGQQFWRTFKAGFKTSAKISGTGESTDSAPPLYPDWNKKAG